MFGRKDKVNKAEKECVLASKAIAEAVADFDGDNREYTYENEIIMLGYLSYILAGTDHSGIATDVLQRYGKANTDGSKLSVNLLTRQIQNEYTEAKKIADALMENEEVSLDEILEAFSHRICRKCDWEATDDNLKAITASLNTFYGNVESL